jgi:malate synthase
MTDANRSTGLAARTTEPVSELQSRVLTPEALAFVADLARRFAARIDAALEDRAERRARLAGGERLGFLTATAEVRAGDWKVAPLPADLGRRVIEITGPVDRKMIINALNSGADVFMADFEDSTAPTWDNLVDGQLHLMDAVRRVITHEDAGTGKRYQLNDAVAVLLVRPRGLHLVEKHLEVDGRAIPGALMDFGLYAFHNARELLARGTGPYFYLPKMESHLEARIWNEIFTHAEAALGIPHGVIKATCLIETLPAAFEMDEILYELREHSAGLNCGRWDYIFSFIKNHREDPGALLPDRSQVTMEQPFMRAYTQLAIRTCHRRGVHAIGGMAAQIPIRDDPEASERALARVRADKLREVKDGHDGTWVAHPGLVKLAREVFEAHMSGSNQLDRSREDVTVVADDLLRVPTGTRTESGLRLNVRVGVQYLEAWLRGFGCVPLDHLMEDAATAEISRTQLWQWIRHHATLEDGRNVTRELVEQVLAEEMERIGREIGAARFTQGRFEEAIALFLRVSTTEHLEEFLTLTATDTLNRIHDRHPLPPTTPEPTPRRSAMNPIPNPEPTTAHPAPHAVRRGVIPDRWAGIHRPYGESDVDRLRGTVKIEHTLARLGAERLWDLLASRDFVPALGAMTGGQAVQQVKAGLEAIYLSGWQVAADANQAGQTYPDQSLYPANSVPQMVRRLNAALMRADQIEHAEHAVGVHVNGNGHGNGNGNGNGNGSGRHRHWLAPIVADAEAGFGGPLNAFELMKGMIEAGAAGVHFEDQLSSEKKCGHLGGKVLVPTSAFIRTLVAARLAADVLDVPTLLIARTDADSAKLITSDVDPRDREFLTGGRTAEGFHHYRGGLVCAIARGLAYAPYADLIWCETSTPDLREAEVFAEAIHAQFPGKMLAYNCSPSFNWKAKLDTATISQFQRELGAMGYKFQFVTLAGFHSLNHSMFDLARRYRSHGMTAYAELQSAEFAAEDRGYTATRHQREVGTGYFDAVMQLVSEGGASTLALEGSTERAQF